MRRRQCCKSPEFVAKATGMWRNPAKVWRKISCLLDSDAYVLFKYNLDLLLNELIQLFIMSVRNLALFY